MDTLKKFMIVLNNPDKYPTEHELAEAALVARRKLNRLVKQRDTVLKLARELHQQRAHTYASENADLYRGFDNGCRHAANRIEAIFAQKEGK